MKVVVAIDSLKDSLTSLEAGRAIEAGIRKAYENEKVDVVVKPLADGGEGTVEALVAGMNGELRTVKVSGPLGSGVDCPYGYLPSTNTAIIEMAGAAGIGLVPAPQRNPLMTTTYGVGEVIRHAAKAGIKHFIVGIGGSVTNDCGVGMLQALGFVFYDADHNPVLQGGRVLNSIASIDTSNVIPELADCRFEIACDVTNPLCGPNGASYVYGPQKGATPEIVEELDRGCANFAKVTAKHFGKDNSETPGVGAAGGLGFAFLSYLPAELNSGIQVILSEINLEDDVKDADIVVTGEGRLDFQTSMGKAPIGVAKLGKKYGAKVIALAGCTTEDAKECNHAGIDAFFSIVNRSMTLEEAMNHENALQNMTNTAEQVFRLIRMTASMEG